MFDKSFFRLVTGFLTLVALSFLILTFVSNSDTTISPADNTALPDTK